MLRYYDALGTPSGCVDYLKPLKYHDNLLSDGADAILDVLTSPSLRHPCDTCLRSEKV